MNHSVYSTLCLSLSLSLSLFLSQTYIHTHRIKCENELSPYSSRGSVNTTPYIIIIIIYTIKLLSHHRLFPNSLQCKHNRSPVYYYNNITVYSTIYIPTALLYYSRRYIVDESSVGHTHTHTTPQSVVIISLSSIVDGCFPRRYI